MFLSVQLDKLLLLIMRLYHICCTSDINNLQLLTNHNLSMTEDGIIAIIVDQ